MSDEVDGYKNLADVSGSKEVDGYKNLADVSGASAHGPKVLSSLLSYLEDDGLRCSTMEECVELVTSKRLHNSDNIANTLAYIQGTALPRLYETKKFHLIASFLSSRNQIVRQRAITLLDKQLLRIEHSAEITDLLEATEGIFHNVLKTKLSECEFLTDETESFLMTVIRLYMTAIAAHANLCLEYDNHSKFKERMHVIVKSKLSVERKKKKSLQRLEEMLEILYKYISTLTSKYDDLTKLKKNMVSKEEKTRTSEKRKEKTLQKVSWPLRFAIFYSMMVELFKHPSTNLAEKIVTFQDYFKTEKSITKKALASEMILNSTVYFLVQMLPSGLLNAGEINKYSATLFSNIAEFIPSGPSAFDLLLYVKEPYTRKAAIDHFCQATKSPPYNTYIIKSNILMVETLLSDVVASFRNETVDKHSYSEEWRICQGTFGGLKVLLNIYIPNQNEHRQDVYVTDVSLGQVGPRREVNLLSNLRHKHLVQVFALSVAKLPYFFVTEDTVISNLHTQLEHRSTNKDTLHPKMLLEFLLHTASALEYIHSQKIIHNNLTAASVSVDEKTKKAKLGDFGLAHVLGEDPTLYLEQQVHDKIPTRWLSPESFRDHAFSKMSDMWMFGCLMYEVLTHGCFPYTEEKISESELAQLIPSGRRKLYHEKCISSDAFNIIMRCTLMDPSERADAATVVTAIKSAKQNMSTDVLGSGGFRFSQYPEIEVRRTRMRRGIPKKPIKDATLTSEILRHYSFTYEQIPFKVEECKYEVTERIPQENRNSDLFRLQGAGLPGLPDFVITSHEREDVVQYNFPVGLLGRLSALFDPHSSTNITNYQYVECLIVAADTLQHLHDIGWVHGDICPENIALQKKGSELKVLFTSFHHMVYMPNQKKVNNPLSQTHLKLKRCAPEVIKDQIYSPSSDVFSFGLLMWEVFDVMFGDGNRVSKMLKFITDEQIYKYFTQSKDNAILPKVDRCPQPLYDIAKTCWNPNRSQRPNMSDISGKLQEYLSVRINEIQSRPLPRFPTNTRKKNPMETENSEEDGVYVDAYGHLPRFEANIARSGSILQFKTSRPTSEHLYEEPVTITNMLASSGTSGGSESNSVSPNLPPRLYSDEDYGSLRQNTSSASSKIGIETGVKSPQDRKRRPQSYVEMRSPSKIGIETGVKSPQDRKRRPPSYVEMRRPSNDEDLGSMYQNIPSPSFKPSPKPDYLGSDDGLATAGNWMYKRGTVKTRRPTSYVEMRSPLKTKGCRL